MSEPTPALPERDPAAEFDGGEDAATSHDQAVDEVDAVPGVEPAGDADLASAELAPADAGQAVVLEQTAGYDIVAEYDREDAASRWSGRVREPADEDERFDEPFDRPASGTNAGTGRPDHEASPEPTDRPPSADPGRRRLSVAGAVIGLLLGLFGFALVTQLHSNSSDQQLQAARPEDLVRILSDLDSRKDRLRLEINSLAQTEQQLTEAGRSQQAAIDAARARADQVGILAGTLAAQGTGLAVTFTPGTKPIKASDVLNAVEELRGAGAEAMQVQGSNGPTVRIVASTYFVDGSDGSLVVDGQTLTGNLIITVIGDPQTMQTALNIPGGVVDTVHQDGGSVTVETSQSVEVTALHQTGPPRYAQPAG
jgi:uncharacterized protein YlxW (UPF0749 family)